MSTVDIILVLILAAFAVSGSRQGLVSTLGQLLGSVIGFWAAKNCSNWLAVYGLMFFPGRPGIARFVAFVLIFLLVDRAIGLLFHLSDKLLSIITHLPFISSLNGLLGAILGFAEGLVLVGSSVYLVRAYHLDATLIAWLAPSSVANFCQHAFQSILGYFL